VDAQQVRALVSGVFSEEGSDVMVEGAGANYSITVVSDQFAGKRPVARQQSVYAALRDAIGSGAIHAVNISTFTREEWDAAQA
jgi:acid stress-induced BolA-like protein IbaG/YrbA